MNTDNQHMKQISTPAPTLRMITKGIALPDRSLPTENEISWIEFIRIITDDTDPPVTLKCIQALRQALTPQ